MYGPFHMYLFPIVDFVICPKPNNIKLLLNFNLTLNFHFSIYYSFLILISSLFIQLNGYVSIQKLKISNLNIFNKYKNEIKLSYNPHSLFFSEKKNRVNVIFWKDNKFHFFFHICF